MAIFWGFGVLRIIGKSTSRHLVQYGQLVWVFLGFACAKNYWLKYQSPSCSVRSVRMGIFRVCVC